MASRHTLSLYHFMAARWRWCSLRGERLAQFQDRRARAIVQHVSQRSAFYRAHWAGHDLDHWSQLPSVDKLAMMANFDAFNTRGIGCQAAMQTALRAEETRDFAPTVNGLTVGLSSGTSGHRGLFLVSERERAMWAGVILARVLHGPLAATLLRLLAGVRVAFFLRSNSNLYEATSRFLHFCYFDLMAPLAESVAGLNVFQPDILIGPPSLLGRLADHRLRNELAVRPERIISVAEVLEPHDRRRLETIFAVRVDQIYQCTEGLLAVSCPQGALHWQEDVVAANFEPLSPTSPSGSHNDRRVTPIVTDLWRTTQPIVRYRLNDVLQVSDRPCPCGSGFRVIESIDGRCDDVFTFEDRPFFPDTIRRMILLASEAIAEYEAVQERPGHLRIGLQLQPGADPLYVEAAVRQSVRHVLAGYNCRAALIEIGFELEAVPPGLKRRRVRNVGRSSK